ncbi:PREDICTED: C-X-C chemokine receptor type 5 [Gekko japonicus]|uniref:C-X-C chemokine receptor type 5 n=1 Tax=Gekko japonicus TaxID=146911 RepID=A0ABM1LC33_GEKJA|nr:PREDICTED: C-X-C chemokine receptor type 5 [Gekko japonicus]
MSGTSEQAPPPPSETTMATTGQFEPFEEWDTFVSRFDFYGTATKITDSEVKKATFLSVCGKKNFKVAWTLVAPTELRATTLTDITSKLSDIACTHAFHKCDQAEGESVAKYVTALRKTARQCNFTDLSDRLRDRLVCGLLKEKLQCCLFAKKSLPFRQHTRKLSLPKQLSDPPGMCGSRECHRSSGKHSQCIGKAWKTLTVRTTESTEHEPKIANAPIVNQLLQHAAPVVVATTTTVSNYTSDNFSSYEDDYLCAEAEDSARHPLKKVFLPLAYLLIFVLGGLGNTLVLVILRRYRHSRTSTEQFLLHLALANLLLGLTFPFGVVQCLAGWVFGPLLCKVLSAVNRISFYSSSLLLGCVSVDRYLAVVHAVRTFLKRRSLSVHLTCLGVWLFSLLLTLPDLLFTEVWPDSNNVSICHFQKDGIHGSNAWLATRFLYHIVGFFLPLAVMCYCYAAIVRVLCRSQRRQRQKAVKVAILVTGVFLLCWSPYHVVIFLDTLVKLGPSGCSSPWLNMATLVSEIIGYSHCCLNPLLYAFVGIRFRRDACRLLHDLGCLRQAALQDILGAWGTESTTEMEAPLGAARQPSAPYPDQTHGPVSRWGPGLARGLLPPQPRPQGGGPAFA